MSQSVNKHGLHCKFICGWSFSKTAWPIEPKLDRKPLWKVVYQEFLFCFDLLTNMATIGRAVYNYGFSVFSTIFYHKIQTTIYVNVTVLFVNMKNRITDQHHENACDEKSFKQSM